MARFQQVKNYHLEQQVFSARVIVLLLFTAVLLSIWTIQLYRLQVSQHDHYQTLAEENRIQLEPLPPNRGLIFDRNGKVLADNSAGFSLMVVPEDIDDITQMIADVSDVIPIGQDDIDRFYKIKRRSPNFRAVPLKEDLTEEEVSKFVIEQHRFTGVSVTAVLQRDYPYKEVLSHVVGYVGRIDEKELARIDEKNYRGTSHIGKIGIERYYETELHGTAGIQRQEINSRGRLVRKLDTVPPIAGRDITLSLDVDLQKVAMDALADYSGSVVAMDPRNGEILAMVSKPGFDPNWFTQGISSKRYKQLNQNAERPLFNRAINGQYPPGSTVKPLTALAGLEQNAITPEKKIFARGYYKLPNHKRKYHDWLRTGHGWVDMNLAIMRSSDVYFYDLANKIGIDSINDMFIRFSLGSKTGVDLLGESSGIVPSTKWKRAALGQPWYPGETLIAGIGQGYMLTTPIQLATMTSCIAMRGTCNRPRFLSPQLNPVDAEVGANEEPVATDVLDQWSITLRDYNSWDSIITPMFNVVHHPRGTAKRIAKDITYQMAGKTGTAQVFSLKEDQKYDSEKLNRKLHDHALFVAFAPLDNPEIALAVVVEHGGGGSSVAAPIARKVLDGYFKVEPEVPAKDEKKTVANVAAN